MEKDTKKVVCIIQARMGSTRLPGKVLMDLEGVPVIGRVLERVLRSKKVDKVIVAMPDSELNDSLEKYIVKNFSSVGVFRGAEDDVLGLYWGAAQQGEGDTIVRITGDCPLIDPSIIDSVLSKHEESDSSYTSNISLPRTFPRGMDTEVFSFSLLEKMWTEATHPDDREHVTFFVRKNPGDFKIGKVVSDEDNSQYRLTLDEPDDYTLITTIFKKLIPINNEFSLEDIIGFLKTEPELAKINNHVDQKHSNV